MTKEEKQILLQDLCARLLYHPRINIYNDSWEGCQTGEFDTNLYSHHIDAFVCDRIEVKPYLRPMSSMTEEEKKEIYKFYDTDGHGFPDSINEGMVSNYVDYCNAHHFDYRGLIEKGLALEAPEGMYD